LIKRKDLFQLEDNSKLIIDKNTGEIVGEINPGDKIIKKKSLDFLEKQQELQEWNIQHFYKGNIDEIKKLNNELSIYEMGLLYAIVPYVNYDDCCLKYNNGQELGFDDIVKLAHVSQGKVSETLNNLLKKDIIYRGKNSKGIQYFVNPWLFCKGNRINVVLKTMFKNYRIRICQNKKWKDI
jgi:hypothetical protein